MPSLLHLGLGCKTRMLVDGSEHVSCLMKEGQKQTIDFFQCFSPRGYTFYSRSGLDLCCNKHQKSECVPMIGNDSYLIMSSHFLSLGQ